MGFQELNIDKFVKHQKSIMDSTLKASIAF